jgi:hypothetical protein
MPNLRVYLEQFHNKLYGLIKGLKIDQKTIAIFCKFQKKRV